jgi:CheY-like chemotaxis protein
MILMDCEMPNMNGYDATREIRTIESEYQAVKIPIYAITAHAVREHVDRCYASGMDGCVAKPVKIDTLKNIIAKHRCERS